MTHGEGSVPSEWYLEVQRHRDACIRMIHELREALQPFAVPTFAGKKVLLREKDVYRAVRAVGKGMPRHAYCEPHDDEDLTDEDWAAIDREIGGDGNKELALPERERHQERSP